MINYKFRLHDEKYNIVGYEELKEDGIFYYDKDNKKKTNPVKGYKYRFPLARRVTIGKDKKTKYDVYVGDILDTMWSRYNPSHIDRVMVVYHAASSAYKCICVSRSSDSGKTFNYHPWSRTWSLSCAKKLSSKPLNGFNMKLELELNGVDISKVLTKYQKGK